MLHALELDSPPSASRRRAVALDDTAPIALPEPAALRRAPAPRLLRARPAGAAAIRRSLAAQADAPAATRAARLLGRDPLVPAAREAYLRARAERSVARRLAGLPGWTLLSTLPFSTDGEIAHLLLGPAGAVVLVDRASTGHRVRAAGAALLAGGAPEGAIRDAAERREDVAARLGVALGHEIPVSAAVVLVGQDPVDVAARTAVPLIRAARLTRFLRRLPAVLGADEVAALLTAARTAGTWRDRPSTEFSDPVEALAFDELEASVRTARRRRLGWELGGVGGFVAACLVGIAVGLPQLLAQALTVALH